ncbi:MAG: MSMEG_0568 family radical SAM protein [Desulfovibrio sp.]|jgi:radical SAM protein (TIGR04043 family)/putative N-acetyltransferase (TIGR04045 family)|nr:MSMEG_0568 family radical SAM protein [Desulfovibrio sp.]
MSTMTLADYAALQSVGARIGDASGARRGGAGPADACAYVIDGRPVMIPALTRPSRESEFVIVKQDGRQYLERGGRKLCAVDPVARPRFYDGTTADGVPYIKVARLHGKDCLASTVIQQCVRYDDPKTRCHFCAIGVSLSRGATIVRKTPEQLVEVASAAKRLDGVTHVTLTAGTTTPPDEGARYLAECAGAITEATGLPVEIQFEPLEDPGLYARFKDMGVTDVGMHIESFDPAVRRRVTPGKAATDEETYFRAFGDAVAVFGRNKVSTYVILGLGEDENRTLEGCARAARMGVYPVLVPLRPLADSYLANAKPASPDYLDRMYRSIGEILRRNGLDAEHSTAGCVRCKACSLLQFTERGCGSVREGAPSSKAPDPAPKIDIRVAETPRDVEAYMQVRKAVFVEEQGIFPEGDADRHDGDADAVFILARVNGEPAGGVRCYRHRRDVWYGGRLAVLQAFRSERLLGAALVRKAVEVMDAHPTARRFLASVQVKNVRFFVRLGWNRLGKPFQQYGLTHQLMERKLKGRD